MASMIGPDTFPRKTLRDNNNNLRLRGPLSGHHLIESNQNKKWKQTIFNSSENKLAGI